MSTLHRLAILSSAILAFSPVARTSTAPWPPIAVARQISPSVVGIVNMQGTPDGPLLSRGSGSGLIIRSDGYVVTNDHVVRGATRLQVLLSNGKGYSGTVVGEDPLTDIAVLRIPAQELPAAHFATDRSPAVGEMAIAIGNPIGLGFARTVTVGVVSGIDRSLGGGYAQRAYGLIQTDAAINPGNSGGPLCNAQGEVIGINSVKISSVGLESLGFAIPAQVVAPVVKALIADGHVTRPWLGISASDGPTLHIKGRPQTGVILSAVVPGGPAHRAGLRPHDVIVAVNGQAVENLSGLYRRLAALRVGDTVTLTLQRNGETMVCKLQLIELPEQMAPA